MPDRSYLTQMDEEDEGFMVPGEDFPVVAGDSGQSFRSRRQILKRTPASSLEKDPYYQEVLLEDELEKLEEDQSDELKSHYRRYEHRLTSKSEKIYFLKLESKYDREDYLESKGINIDHNMGRSIASLNSEYQSGNRELTQGMSKAEVRSYWGSPYSVEVAGNPKYENERWAYKRRGYIDYVYFESGKVDGWAKNR